MSTSAQSSTSEQFAFEVRKLSHIHWWRGMLAIGLDWCVIAAAIAAAIVTEHPAVWIIAGIVIAARQHALLIIMHDASHFRLLSSRSWNDRVSNWLLAWPLLVSTEAYRENHLAHHLHLNTDDDPDWLRKQGQSAWTFPKTRLQLALLLMRDCCGGGALDQFRALRALSRSPDRKARSLRQTGERLGYYAVLSVVISISGTWIPVLLLWFLPAFTVLPMLLRIRSIAEHFGVEGETRLNMSRNTFAQWWERMLLSPHCVGLHLDHHLYPAVPFYNLPKLHQLLSRDPQYAAAAHQSASLFGGGETSVLAEVTCGR